LLGEVTAVVLDGFLDACARWFTLFLTTPDADDLVPCERLNVLLDELCISVSQGLEHHGSINEQTVSFLIHLSCESVYQEQESCGGTQGERQN